jgi:hypothetical protein
MAMTARPMVDASSTKQPSCSRIGMRILTILCRPGDGVFSVSERRGRAWRLGTQRISVSCTSRALSNVQDEAIGKRIGSSVSHSSWRGRVRVPSGHACRGSKVVGDGRGAERR